MPEFVFYKNLLHEGFQTYISNEAFTKTYADNGVSCLYRSPKTTVY